MSKFDKRVTIITGGGWVVTNDTATCYFDSQGFEYGSVELGHSALFCNQEHAEACLAGNPNVKAVQVRYLQFETHSLAPSEVEPF